MFRDAESLIQEGLQLSPGERLRVAVDCTKVCRKKAKLPTGRLYSKKRNAGLMSTVVVKVLI
jgi:hypothetical protein